MAAGQTTDALATTVGVLIAPPISVPLPQEEEDSEAGKTTTPAAASRHAHRRKLLRPHEPILPRHPFLTPASLSASLHFLSLPAPAPERAQLNGIGAPLRC
jgi:hypothetical protein